MQKQVTRAEAKAVVEAARDAAPVWTWESFEGDPRWRYGRRAVGRVDIGDLSFSIYFYGAGNNWDIHWGQRWDSRQPKFCVFMAETRVHSGRS